VLRPGSSTTLGSRANSRFSRDSTLVIGVRSIGTRLGAVVSAGAQAPADAGYAPAATAVGEGFVRYAFIEGRPACAGDLDDSFLAELAR
jgi:hypothetical protein